MAMSSEENKQYAETRGVQSKTLTETPPLIESLLWYDGPIIGVFDIDGQPHYGMMVDMVPIPEEKCGWDLYLYTPVTPEQLEAITSNLVPLRDVMLVSDTVHMVIMEWSKGETTNISCRTISGWDIPKDWLPDVDCRLSLMDDHEQYPDGIEVKLVDKAWVLTHGDYRKNHDNPYSAHAAARVRSEEYLAGQAKNLEV